MSQIKNERFMLTNSCGVALGGVQRMTKLCTTQPSGPRTRYVTGPVLLVTPWYRPTVGGVVEVADCLRRLLSKAGVETHLLVCDEDSSARHIQADPTVKNVWRFQIPSYAFYRLTLKTIATTLIRGSVTFWRLFRFVQKHRVRSVVLIYPIEYSWPFLLLRHIMGVRLIASLHGNEILKYSNYSDLSRWLFRCVLRGSAAITVSADHLAQKARELFPDTQLPIRLIPYCVDVNHFVPPPPGFHRFDTRPTLVHVSNFRPKKRTVDIIEAFAIAALPSDSRLIMVGAGADLEAAMKRARSLGVDHRVEFVGPQKDVRPFLWKADLLIIASEEESGPLVLLEAMACKLPWVATGWGIAATLPPAECGLVVPSASPKQLAIAMEELINNPQRRREMGLRGRMRAEVDFSEDKYLESHLQLIEHAERTGSRPELHRRSPKLPDEGYADK